MRRSIERLEERKLFSVTDLIIDPIAIVGDFNGDGKDDLASFTLPYVEQDNLYNLVDINDSPAASFVAALYTDLLSRPVNAARLTSITDGSSNTLMFGKSVPPVDVDLLGLMVDTSPIDLSVVSLDTWEHA